MRTVTFYSYKGGVGRTLAATNFAVYLAKLGQRTVLLDFDLEAPGVDSKFPNLVIPSNHRGLLNYILHYQETNSDPGPVEPLAIEVPPTLISGSIAPLWLLPAGDYLSAEYYQMLSRLDWSFLFQERDGVAFFQQLLVRIKEEFRPDYLIVDSRTGIGEIAGVCTQQLADEVVILSSLSSESIKVTKHIAQLIRRSEVAKALEKSIDIKVVVSRVPKLENLENLKQRCCELFDVEATKLFFLFSCPALEQEEFIALAAPQKDEELVASYVRLFYGLNVQLAAENIQAQIERTARSLLSQSPEESQNAIVELVALYPHPDVYRTAMRFFHLVNKKKSMRNFASRLLDFVPDDEEAQKELAKSYLAEFRIEPSDRKEALRAIEPLWKRRELSPKEVARYADLLEDEKRYSDSMQVALPLSSDESADEETRVLARSIAARCAVKFGRLDLAHDLISNIPPSGLTGSLAIRAVEMRRDAGDHSGAFELATQVLRHQLVPELILLAGRLARDLNRINDLESAVRSSENLSDRRARRPFMIGEVAEALGRIGLTNLAQELSM